jgi:GTP-binding protein
MVPADSKDHKAEFEVLVNELKQYNPEMLDKERIYAISKSDLLDDELREAISAELMPDFPHLYFSSVSGDGLTRLKDELWKILQGEENSM